MAAFAGCWHIEDAARLDRDVRSISPETAIGVRLDIGEVEALDTAGAWLIYRTAKRLRGEGYDTEIVHANPRHEMLLDMVRANDNPVECRPPAESSLLAVIGHLGRATIEICSLTRDMVAFLGITTVAVGRCLARPWRIRWTSLFSHMEETGLNAVPIVCLMSFLVGVVLAYQGVDQLRKFGAEIYVVDLVAIGVLREIGIMITAILIAGRSGSAFTAAIGSMKLREEIDAMRTMGLDPMEVLVVPRLLALVLAMPLLAFAADIMGLFGGAILAKVVIGIDFAQFVAYLRDAVSIESFWIGILKAPVFAVLIAMVGCFEGFRTGTSAESLGRHTTKSVVEAIFLVIVFNAAFSVLFSYLGI